MITFREHKEKEVRVYSNGTLALVGRLSRLFYVLTAEKEFFGELDLYDLPPVFFNGVFEVTAHYGRVCVKNGRWRKAEVFEFGGVKTVYNHNGDETLERPGRKVGMVTYIPAWVGVATVFRPSQGDNLEVIEARYSHASERFLRTMDAVTRSSDDTLLIVDIGGWPGLVYRLFTYGKAVEEGTYAELIYAGIDGEELDPKNYIGKVYPGALYCGQSKEFKTVTERRNTRDWV